MIKYTNENTNSDPFQNLGINPETFQTDSKIEDSDFWTGEKCFRRKLPDHRLKMKSNSEKRRLLAKQNPKRVEAAKFIIDYIPLCIDEDWEMMAYVMSKDQQEKVD